MAYNLHYDRLLRTIQCGEEQEAISLFTSNLFNVNEQIEYIFEDRKRYTVTPLYWAVRHRRPQVCKYLLRNGARAYEHMVYEYFPLHEACNMGYDEIVQEFVEAKCNLDQMTSDCDTPLHVACMRGHISCVHILLRAGADCNLQNKVGHTPLEAALYHNHRDMVSLFKAHDKAAMRDCTHRDQPQTLQYERSKSPIPIPTSSTHPIQRRHSYTGTSLPRLPRQQQQQHQQQQHQQQVLATPIRSSPISSSASTSPYAPQSSTLCYSQSLNSPPTLVTQLSQASSCIADSPSPVEKDGVVPKSSSGRHNQGTHSEQPTFRPDPYFRTHQPAVVSSVAPPVVHSSGKTVSMVTGGHSPSPTGYEPKYSCPFPCSGASSSFTRETKSPSQQEGKHLLSAPFSSLVPSRIHSPLHLSSRPPLSESASNPELGVPRREVLATDRAKSFDDLFSRSKKGSTASEKHALSGARVHIDSVSQIVWKSLESFLQYHGKHPYLDSVHGLLNQMLPVFKVPPAQYKSLVEIGKPLHAPTYLPTATPPPPLPEFTQPQEVEYDIIEGPWEVKLGVPTVNYMSLIFKIRTRDHRIQATTQSPSGEASLKVISKVFNLANEQVWVQYHSLPTATAAAFSSYDDSCVQEVAILKQLPPHPNIVELVHHFKGSTERFVKHAKLHNPDDPLTLYMMAPTGDFLILQPSCRTMLSDAVKRLKQKFPKPCSGNVQDEEEEILMIIAQVLLALAHLNRHHIAHCAVLPKNVLIDEEKGSVILANFSHALNLNPHNLEAIRIAITQRLKDNDFCAFSPEVPRSLFDLDTQTNYTLLQENLDKIFGKSDLFAAGKMIYDLILEQPSLWFSNDDQIPYLELLSPRSNQLLRKLVACNPEDRLSALQGAVCSLFLLYGPRESEVKSLDDCHRWLFSETLELHLRPVLKDYENVDFADARSKLRYIYLTIADPKHIWDACKLFRQV